MEDSEKLAPLNAATPRLSTLHSRNRTRSDAELTLSRPSKPNDNILAWPVNMAANSNHSYPTLDLLNTTLLRPPQSYGASQFPSAHGSVHTTSTHAHIAGIRPHPAISTVLLSPPQLQQQQIWPFIHQQPSAYNMPLMNVSQGHMNPCIQRRSPYSADAAGPCHILTTQHSTKIPTSQTSSPVGPSSPQPPLDTEEVVILEEKRRRNTEASARFRTKKKQKSFELERAVSGLTLRADELEKEASDLRRENAWLKEIVIMKGRCNTFKRRTPHAESSGDSERDDSSKTSSAADIDTGNSKNRDTKKRKGKGEGKNSRNTTKDTIRIGKKAKKSRRS